MQIPKPRTLAIIPARYGSTRFPGKPLAMLGNKPLIAHVIDRAREAKSVDEVIVATDDDRIRLAVESFGGKAVMTSPNCATGSDRIAQVAAQRPDAGIIVNVQGDEPLMPAEVIDRAVESLIRDLACAVSTAMIRINCEEDYLSPHVVKVVCDQKGQALYFSRSPIPNLSRASEKDKTVAAGSILHQRKENDPSGNSSQQNHSYAHFSHFWGFKHFGLYVYRRDALLQFVKMPPTPLENLEKLEQLRFLENGMKIRIIETTLNSIGVDTPEDLENAKRIMGLC